MSEFNSAFTFMLAHEDAGLTGAITVDTGGRTRFGIAENSNHMPPEFWDAHTPKDEVLHLAKAVYLQKYWKFESLSNQNVANKLFDMSVNLGQGQACKILQKCLCLQGVSVDVDGAFGPKTAEAANRADGSLLLTDLRGQLSDFYVKLAEQDKYKPFLKGWLRRAAS